MRLEKRAGQKERRSLHDKGRTHSLKGDESKEKKAGTKEE